MKSCRLNNRDMVTDGAKLDSSIVNEQYTHSELLADATWTITHKSDPTFRRIIQAYKDIVEVNNSLDFDTADKALFTQEDDTKTDFISNQLQLFSLTPSANMMAYWKLNDTLLDSSGRGHTLTYNSGTFDDGKLGRCLNYNGAQYSATPNHADFNQTSKLSIEAWVYLTSYSSPSPRTIVDKNQYWFYAIATTGALTFLRTKSGAWASVSGPVVPLNTWTHVAVTYDSTSVGSEVILYMNGVAYGPYSLVGPIDTGTTTFTIGERLATHRWAGKIDEVAFYNINLSASVIANHYNSGTGKYYDELYDTSKGWYVNTNTNQINTSTWQQIKAVTITQTLPTVNTDLRYLISVDNKVTWKKFNGATWDTVALADIHTQGNTKAEIEAISNGQWTLMFVSGTLDFACGLKTTDSAYTPYLDQINIAYSLIGKLKVADCDITIGIVNDTQSTIKNITVSPIYNIRATIDL